MEPLSLIEQPQFLHKILVETTDDNFNIELLVLPICEYETGERLVKIGNNYFDAYQLTRILKTLKGE